jgi:hypothetical protein
MNKREFLAWFICVVLLILLGWLIIANYWGLTIFGSVVDHTKFGTWGQMVSAIGTTIAFLIGFWNLYYQRSQYNTAEKRRKEEEETSVYIWISIIEEKDEVGNHVGWQYDLNVQNATKFPISKWLVKFSSRTEHLCNFQKKPLIPGENVFNLTFFDDIEPNTLPESEIIFESKMKKTWNRKSTGSLEEVASGNLKCEHNK